MPDLQPLTLSFRKTRPQTILTVRRADGTSTWMKLYPGMTLHDLAHYVIETELCLGDAFYGILARGYDIGDFEAPRARRPAELLPENMPPVALQVEHLVNLLLTERQSGRLDDFIPQLSTILAGVGLPLMTVLTEEKLSAIRQELEALRQQWMAVPAEDELVLEMPFGEK